MTWCLCDVAVALLVIGSVGIVVLGVIFIAKKFCIKSKVDTVIEWNVEQDDVRISGCDVTYSM